MTHFYAGRRSKGKSSLLHEIEYRRQFSAANGLREDSSLEAKNPSLVDTDGSSTRIR